MKLKIGFSNCMAVGCEGRRGGLALLWRNSVNLSVKSFSGNHIDSWVRNDNGSYWRFTGFYGNCESTRKLESWNKLRALGRQVNFPWLCCGDFNEILVHSEKRGGVRMSDSLLDNFKEVLEECNLFDCEASGYQFTWCNNQDGLIEARLDRFLVNPEWRLMFPRAHFANEEVMWLRDPGCEELVKNEWSCRGDLNAGETITTCIKECSKSLDDWNRCSFGKVRKEIKELEKRIKVLGRYKDRGRNRQMLKQAKDRLHELKEREEIMWRQRSRAIWLREGDRNTSFFHHTATDRRETNSISGHFNSAGIWTDKEEEMKAVAKSYFEEILCSTKPDKIEEVLDCVETCLQMI